MITREYAETLSGRLNWAMNYRQQTTRDLSKNSGVSIRNINYFRNGVRKNPTIIVIKKLADALGMDSAWLAWGDTYD